MRQSTGIQAPRTEYPPVEDTPRLNELYELYERSLPLFDEMRAHKLEPAEPVA